MADLPSRPPYGVYGIHLARSTYWLFAAALITAAPAAALGLGLSRQTAGNAVGLAALCCGMLVWPARKAAAQLGPAGPLRLAQAGLGVFVVGALLAAVAPDGATLLAGRALQGVSGAMVLPYAALPGLPALAGLPGLPAPALPALPALFTIWAVAAPAAVLLGGLLTSALGWQWVFWLSLPVAVAALAAITLDPASGTPPDGRAIRNEHYTPLVLLVPGLLAAYAVLTQGSAWHWGSARTLVLIAVAVFALALFARWEREHAEDPQLDLSPRPAAVFLLHFAVVAALYVLLGYLQAPRDGHGLPALTAALFGLPLAAGAYAARAARFPAAVPPMAGAALAALGLVLTALTGLGPAAYYPLVLIGTALTGAGLALGVPAGDPHPAAGRLGAAAGIAVAVAVTTTILAPDPTALGRATACALLVCAAFAALSVFTAVHATHTADGGSDPA